MSQLLGSRSYIVFISDDCCPSCTVAVTMSVRSDSTQDAAPSSRQVLPASLESFAQRIVRGAVQSSMNGRSSAGNFSREIERAVRHERSLGLKNYLEQTGFTIMQSKEPCGPFLQRNHG